MLNCFCSNINYSGWRKWFLINILSIELWKYSILIRCSDWQISKNQKMTSKKWFAPDEYPSFRQEFLVTDKMFKVFGAFFFNSWIYISLKIVPYSLGLRRICRGQTVHFSANSNLPRVDGANISLFFLHNSNLLWF